jgi:FkbM family methyltransferase
MALPKELDERPDHRVPAVVGVGDHRVVVRTSWGTSLVALGTDGHGPDLVMPEVYDPETVHAATRSVHPGDIALDAGAGIGAITVQLARSVGHRGRVVAVEPDEQAHALLLENLALNGVTDWVDAATEWSALDAVLAGDTQIALLRTSGYAATLAALDRAESAILARRVRRLLVRTDSVVAHRDAPEVLARFDHYRRWLGASFSRVSVNGTAVATTVEGLASSDDDRAVLVDLVPSA